MRERENGFWREEKAQGLKDVHCLKIPGVVQRRYYTPFFDPSLVYLLLLYI